MLRIFWTLIVSLAPAFAFSQGDVEGLRQSAPTYLTTETATQNLAAARMAARAYNLDADLLLSTAYYESHYKVNEVTHEPGGKISCGVMTPVPTYDRAKCLHATESLLAGYMAGAKHLRSWFVVCRGNERCAILGYVGGYRMISACAKGPVIRHSDGDDLCKTSQVRLRRAWYIERLRDRATARARRPQS